MKLLKGQTNAGFGRTVTWISDSCLLFGQVLPRSAGTFTFLNRINLIKRSAFRGKNFYLGEVEKADVKNKHAL